MSLEAWDDEDKRYPGNEVDLEHNDYDVMRCSMRNYYFTSVCVSVSGSGADSVLCSLFGVLYFRLEIIFLFRVLGFRFCLYAFFLGFCTFISGFWMFVLYYGHQGKLSVFYIVWFYFVFCDSGFILCFRFESVFLFWVLVFLFGFCGMYFPYRPPYIWPPYSCKSIH